MTSSSDHASAASGATDSPRAQAIARLKRKRAFTWHLMVYLAITLLLTGIWLTLALSDKGTWFPWPLFPALGWGLGLAAQAAATFGPASRGISESAIEAEVRRMQRG